MEEPYITQFCTGCPNDKWELKADEYFVLGDNRNNSFDSHSFGPINRHLIVGQAWIRYWPIQDIGFIQHPRYADVPPSPVAPTDEPTPLQPSY
jgi:signal peptidase I